MSAPYEVLLKKYLQLPDRLEATIAGLNETELDLRGAGWSIRKLHKRIFKTTLPKEAGQADSKDTTEKDALLN